MKKFKRSRGQMIQLSHKNVCDKNAHSNRINKKKERIKKNIKENIEKP